MADVVGKIVEAIVEGQAPVGSGQSQPLITAEDAEALSDQGGRSEIYHPHPPCLLISGL